MIPFSLPEMTMAKGRSRGFGEFLSRITSAVNDEFPEKLELSDEEDARITRIAIARATAPRKIKELQDENQRLQAEVDQLKKRKSRRAGSKKREARLKSFIQTVQAENPNLSQIEIARHVDRRLGIAKTNLSAVCPPKWHQYNLPSRLADVFSRPSKDRLLQRVKSYISKA